MVTDKDVEQLVYLFGVPFERQSKGDIITFVVNMFGVKIIYGEEFGYIGNDKDWHIVKITPDDNLVEKREEVILKLIEAGYFHYLRNTLPGTFKKMISQLNWDRKLVNERLERYGGRPKYNYWASYTKSGLNDAANFVMATDPGFYDFLPPKD